MRTLQWSVLLGLVHYTMGLGKQDHGHSNKPDPEVSDSIGCYVCTSLNGSNPSCHDDFDKAHPTSQSFYRPSCSTPKFNKNGKTIGTRLAKRCYKLKATRDSDQFHIIVRDCDTVVEGGNPQDTIASTSYHCPTKIIIGQEAYFGCLLTCDFDGCNSALPTSHRSAAWLMFSAFLAPLLTFARANFV